MPSWIVPSDSHVVSDTGHTTDHNHMADDFTLINNALPVVSGGLTGAVAAARFAGATASGAPASGTFVVGDYVVDQTGTMWVCTSGGSPGTWVALVSTAAPSTGWTVSGGAAAAPPFTASNPTSSAFVAVFHAFAPNVGTGQSAIFRVGQGLGGQSAEFDYIQNSPRVFVYGFHGGPQTMGFDDTGSVWTGTFASKRNKLDDGSGNAALVGGLSTALRTITASATLTATDSVVLLNAATLTATLPTAVGITGRAYTVKLVFASTGTVATTSSQTIDGSTTYSLSANHKYVTVVSDGANWQITANN